MIDKTPLKRKIDGQKWKYCAKGERINGIILVWKSGKTPSKEHWITPKSNSLLYNCDTLPHQKTLTRLGNTSHETTAPYKAGLFIWKGYEMKKYIPLDFDEKGNAVLGNAKNTPTSNGFIPTTWAPGGEAGNGIKSITISPAITTTPALDSLFPIYYDDLTEEEKAHGLSKEVELPTGTDPSGAYDVTITPTSDWYVRSSSSAIGEKGEPVVVRMVVESGSAEMRIDAFASNGATQETTTEFFGVQINIYSGSPV